MRELETLSAVALLEKLADKGLLRGQVGTIVEQLGAGVYEVEFSDDLSSTTARRMASRWASAANTTVSSH